MKFKQLILSLLGLFSMASLYGSEIKNYYHTMKQLKQAIENDNNKEFFQIWPKLSNKEVFLNDRESPILHIAALYGSKEICFEQNKGAISRALAENGALL